MADEIDEDENYNPVNEMIFVTGGTLTLGSDEEEDNPEHDVTLDDFYMAKYEVTQQLYEEVMGENPSEFKGPKRPVENVSWYDAVEFCNELSKREGLEPCYKIDKKHEDPDNKNEDDDVKWTVHCDWTANGYRLPTEAEWEYAAKGGQKSKGTEYAGSDDIDEVAWYEDNSDYETHSIGKRKPNELELYDMSGNVEEWCWDWYGDDYLEDGMDNPRGPVSGSSRSSRGGFWHDYCWQCAVASRDIGGAHERCNDLGFRVCRSSSKCKVQNEDGKFCKECGTSLVDENEFKSPSCGAEIDPKAKSCSECGAKIDGETKGKTEIGEKKLSVEMVKVEGGTLTLGSDNQGDDNPKHDVTLDDFYMAKYEVTQLLYKDVMGINPSEFKGPKRPVDYVCWYDAVEFCNKLSLKEGLIPCYTIVKNKKDRNNENDLDDKKWTVNCNFKANGYRLPTEAEWEYAARGGQKSQGYEYAGSDDIDEVAWYYYNSNEGTYPVGRKKPNELGIYDMSGNVWEWCWDWYDKEPDEGDNPTGPDHSSVRVQRGGSYNLCASECRLDSRECSCGNASVRDDSYGFRVCRNAN